MGNRPGSSPGDRTKRPARVSCRSFLVFIRKDSNKPYYMEDGQRRFDEKEMIFEQKNDLRKLGLDFFHRDRLEVAPDLVGKLLVHRLPDGRTMTLRISETEAYGGEEDTACHAHRGRTPRTELLYGRAGTIYVYLCYGIHWLLNIITGEEGSPEGVLIRACEKAPGPGRLTRLLGVNKEVNGTDITSGALTVWDDGARYEIVPDCRVGIGYASPEDQARLWRFKMGARKDWR